MTLTQEARKSIIENSILKSHQAIHDAELLLNSNSYIGALNRIYYGIFYIISALAIKHGFSASKHSQLIGWFNKNYVRNSKVDRKIGKFIHLAFHRRMDGDYNALVEFCYNDVAEDLVSMKETIAVIEDIINSIEENI